MRKDYRAWLEAQSYGANTVSTQCSNASRVEQAYGDLDEAYATDRMESILSSLKYSSADGRRGAPNPSKVHIGGDLYKSLASFRTAVGLYRRFRDEAEGIDPSTLETVPSGERAPTAEARERIGLERDLQKALRGQIEDLEAGLVIIDDGAERPVPSGYVDITARDTAGTVVVIELKAGAADRTAIGQVLSYMGDVADEEDAPVRGILVAHNFDDRAKAAARVVPNLTLRSYSVRFSFGDPT
jgi:endonuclease